MNNPAQAKTLQACATFLARWNGGRALLEELTVSHKTLRIDLRLASRAGKLRLACLDPQHIHAPISWEPCALAVEAVVVDGRAGFVVRDPAHGVEIVCGGIEVKELRR